MDLVNILNTLIGLGPPLLKKRYEKTVGEQNQTIATLKKIIEEQNLAIANLNKVIEEKNIHIANLERRPL